MLLTDFPPFLIFYIGALLAALTHGRTRNILMLAVPFISIACLLSFTEGSYFEYTFFNYSLTAMRIDKLSLVFAYAFHIAAFIAIVYSLHVRDTTQQVAALLYAGSGLGAVFAGDLLTLFVFWEMLALTSVFLIWARRTKAAYAAGLRYLIVQVTSGLFLLVGILFIAAQGGSFDFNHIGLSSFSLGGASLEGSGLIGIASWFIFIAFGIKCAFPMMHNWLTDAYPEATPTGTVFLSAFTTKVAVYALARGYAGEDILIYIGAAMTCFPIFFAVIENDLRRVLAYSLINQVGFMVCGIGIGTALALNGAISHAFNDIIFKGLLFMTMGSVLHMTGKMNASELGGLYKTMPKTTIFCLIGAASISAFPLFSGFVSKSMVMVAAIEGGHDIVWLMLLFASAGVFHHAGIKIPFFAFFSHDSGIRASDPPFNMLAAMFVASALCIGIGIYPEALYAILPYENDYYPYDATHTLAQMQLLFFSALAFVWLNKIGKYPPELRSVNLDVDWLYRRLFPSFVSRAEISISASSAWLFNRWDSMSQKLSDYLSYKHLKPDGLFFSTRPTGSMVLSVVVFFIFYLLLSFVQ